MPGSLTAEIPGFCPLPGMVLLEEPGKYLWGAQVPFQTTSVLPSVCAGNSRLRIELKGKDVPGLRREL